MDSERLPEERMRASDADRNAAVEQLAHALTEGRLTLAEYDERLSAALRATNLGELARLTEDLPPASTSARSPVDLAKMGRAQIPAQRWRGRLEPWRGFAGLAIILIGIWLVTSIMAGELLYFWPGWPLGIMLVIIAAEAVRKSSS